MKVVALDEGEVNITKVETIQALMTRVMTHPIKPEAIMMTLRREMAVMMMKLRSVINASLEMHYQFLAAKERTGLLFINMFTVILMMIFQLFFKAILIVSMTVMTFAALSASKTVISSTSRQQISS